MVDILYDDVDPFFPVAPESDSETEEIGSMTARTR